MKIRFAPNWFAVIARSVLLVGAILLVATIMLVVKGPSRSSRDVRRNEIVLFAPSAIGLAQLGEQMLLVAVLAWAFRGPLKVRL